MSPYYPCMFTDVVRRYICKLMSYKNASGVWYPIERAPFPPSWAVVDGNPRIMHRVHLNRPVLLWIVGALINIRLLGAQGAPSPTLQVVVHLLRAHDRTRVMALHNAASTVPIRTMGALTISSAANEDEGPLVSPLPVSDRCLSALIYNLFVGLRRRLRRESPVRTQVSYEEGNAWSHPVRRYCDG